MPVVRLYYEDMERLIGASRDTIMSRLAMMGADIGKRAEEEYVDVEFFPDRPDLYSPEGVARAMQGFLGLRTGLVNYDVEEGPIVLEVDDSVKSVRPIIGCSVVRGLEFSDEAIESIMGLQEDLHWGLGRNRRKVAIGVHDISRVVPPFRYLGADPAREFVPLDFSEKMSMHEILQKHPKGRDYGHILDGCERYPLIVDANDDVLSFPPVINGELTRVTDESHDLFIDVTGTDPVVFKALNIVVTSLAERGGRIESVLVRRSEGDFRSPDLRPAPWTVASSEANKLIGFELKAPELADCLERMRFGAKAEGESVQVQVPAYRADIMHSWDIFEDAAKAFGYDRLVAEIPKTVTVGQAHPSEVRKAEVREIMAGLGYLEAMPFTLTNETVHFDWMRRPREGATRVMHPISELHTILRTSLLSSVLEIFSLNQHHPLPQRIFAAGDVVVGRKTNMHLAAASIHSGANFSEIRSVADAVLREMGLEKQTKIVPSEDGALLPGRGADILVEDENIGLFGEIHPLVLRSFGLEQPVVALELKWGEL
ncbi:MAG: Phenylalanine--tRNA ligase beta subunit [Methanosaeta sp. PtaU1.Bin060]|nr:MAG: Phenylalanine--tRNA ligase beta subunit [Methanosaeta sp. PtaU1.Bin060]